MEKAKDMAPEKNITEDVSIMVPEANAGSSSTASAKETPRCRPNCFNEHASSSPSNKVACLNWTSCRSQTNDPIEDWTFRAVSVFEWILVVCSVAGLLVGLILAESEDQKYENEKEEEEDTLQPLEILWRCCALVLVIVCGRHFMGWMMMRVKNSLAKWIFNFFKGNAHYSYYIYGLRKSVGVFLWFVLILLAWYLLLDTSDELKSWSGTEIQNFIRRNLITLVIVGALWVVKTFLVNKLSSSFQVTSNFDWIRSSLINQYILEVFERPRKTVVPNLIDKLDGGKEYPGVDGGKEHPGVIYRLLNIDPNEVSAWTMEDFIDGIRSIEFSSITKELEKLVDEEDFRAKLEYENEVPELDAAVDLIFNKINLPRKPKIVRDDIISLCSVKEEAAAFLKKKKKEAAAMIQQINGQKLVPRFYDNPSVNQINQEVSIEALKMWLMHATVERKTLVQSINDVKSAIKELNELFSSIVLILLVVIWSLMVGLLTRDGLVLILSQIFVFTFIFGNTARNAFEGIIFVFVKHPFDIGDLCLINREEVVVQRINLFTTIFQKKNKDKVCYSNSVLSTMAIINFYRGNVYARDSLEFTTKWPIELQGGINSLRYLINERLCKDQQKKWFPKCDLVVKELEEEKKAKMVLSVTYCNANVHKSGVTMIWLRHELIIALNQLLRDLNIEHYKIRPEEVDCMKSTAKPQSTQETNLQSNESKCEASTSELKEGTATA